MDDETLMEPDEPESPARRGRVWRILGRHRLNTRALRYQLLTAHATPGPAVLVVPSRRTAPPGRLSASRPGELVQMDTFHVGSFKETRLGSAKAAHGQIWQYTAIDVASSWLWAELHTTAHNPSAALTSALAHRVAADERVDHVLLPIGDGLTLARVR